ncbi:hypothetical protein [Bdellovibrio sp. HCB337]|uniref:hypothetical protein n=1 Tax=Bdellovibrio sp. HCB337 TaxID=3394358 RepID=UPI0039A774CF
MKLISRLLISVVLFATPLAWSAPAKKLTVQQLVDQYYQQKEMKAKLFSSVSSRPPINCNPSGPSCTDVACEKLGHFGCDDMSEIQDVGRACRGNYDGTCVAAACEKLGHFGCDEITEITSVGRACVGNYDTSCLDSVCNRLGHFGCDEVSEIDQVLRSCAGN